MSRDVFGIGVCSIVVLAFAGVILLTSNAITSANDRKASTCNTIIYSVYGEVQTAECVDSLSVGSDIVSYSQDGLTIYVRPDLLAVKEHTHE